MATSDGLSKEERELVKERAKELRDQAKAGKSRAAGEKAVQDAIADMPEADAEIATRIHEIIGQTAPDLVPKTWYGMPAWANADGEVVVFFQAAAKFKYRYATLGFQEDAHLDDGDLWPTSYALTRLTPAVEKRITELIEESIS